MKGAARARTLHLVKPKSSALVDGEEAIFAVSGERVLGVPRALTAVNQHTLLRGDGDLPGEDDVSGHRDVDRVLFADGRGDLVVRDGRDDVIVVAVVVRVRREREGGQARRARRLDGLDHPWSAQCVEYLVEARERAARARGHLEVIGREMVAKLRDLPLREGAVGERWRG